jgi:CheY-like chemotaxis protein
MADSILAKNQFLDELITGEHGQGKEGWEDNYTILAVEDYRIIQKIHHMSLSQWGFNFKIVDTGERALQEYHELFYHLLILDLGLPGTIQGLDVAREIRAIEQGTDKHTVIIVNSATGDHHRDDCLAAGCDEVLVKGVSSEVIYNTIKQHLLKREG